MPVIDIEHIKRDSFRQGFNAAQEMFRSGRLMIGQKDYEAVMAIARQIREAAYRQGKGESVTTFEDLFQSLHDALTRITARESVNAQADKKADAIRVMEALQEEAMRRRKKFGGDLFQARDVDPEVFDIAKSILDEHDIGER